MSFLNNSLILSKVSLEDGEEYWCAIVHQKSQPCRLSAKTLLIRREDFGIYYIFYAVWSSLLSGLLVMLSVVVLIVFCRTRKAWQLS